MQEIPSLGITLQHHLASLMMPNIYPRDGIFNQHLTTIKDSYNLQAPVGDNWPKIVFSNYFQCKNYVYTQLIHSPAQN